MSEHPKDAAVAAHETVFLSGGDSLEEWDRFVDQSEQGTIFSRSFWLKAVQGADFEILTIRKAGRILAGIPLPHPRGDKRRVLMPPFTQVLGILLAPSQRGSYEGRLSEQTDTMKLVVASLPAFALFKTQLHYSIQNWLPFYWEGYQQTTSYTYVIEDLQDMDEVLRNYDHSKRKNLKRAEKLVQVKSDLEPRRFYDHHAMTLGREGDKIRYSFEEFERIHSACVSRGSGRTFYAEDASGVIHSAIFVIWDAHSAYYLISSIDPEQRNSGATTLLIHHAMTELRGRTRRFDFEGSMIPGVENSFRKFGAIQKPILQVSRDRRPASEIVLLKAKSAAARLLGRLKSKTAPAAAAGARP